MTELNRRPRLPGSLGCALPLAIEGRAPDRIQFTWITADANVSHAHVGTNCAQTLRAEARAALVGLGWKSGIAGAAVDDALGQVGTNVGIDALIREALRRCPRPSQARVAAFAETATDAQVRWVATGARKPELHDLIGLIRGAGRAPASNQ